MLSKDGAHLVLGRWEGNSGRRNQTHDLDTLLPARLLSLANGAIPIAFGDCSGAFSPVAVLSYACRRDEAGLRHSPEALSFERDTPELSPVLPHRN